MTSLLDGPITAASDDGVCRWHQAAADTCEIIDIVRNTNLLTYLLTYLQDQDKKFETMIIAQAEDFSIWKENHRVV